MTTRNEQLDAFIKRQQADASVQQIAASYWPKYLIALDDEITEVLNRIEGRKVGNAEAVTFLYKTSTFNEDPKPGQPRCIETIFWKSKPIIEAALFPDTYMIKSV